MVVLRKDGVLIFIEVKDHSNHKDLRSKTRPPVCDQLLEYHEWLKDHRDEVAAAYTNSRKLLKQINCRHPLAGDEPLKVDTIPRLLIFGYDTPQQTKLRKEIVPLIVRCTAQEIKGFGGQHVLARGAASGFTDEQLE